jgi:fucose permease
MGSKQRKATTIGYFAAFVALGLAYASLGPTLTDLAANVRVDLSKISYALSARGLGYLMGSVVGGRLYDRVGGHPVMAAMLVLVSALLIAIPFAAVLWLLIALIFLIGVFEGAIDVGGNTLLVWLHGDRVDPYMNAMHFFFGVGAFFSPVIIAQSVARIADIRWAYWILAFLLLPVVGLLVRLPSPTGSPPAPNDDDTIGVGTGDPRAHNGQLIALIALFFFLYVGAEASFGGWVAAYAQATGLGNAVTAAYLTSAFWGAMTFGRLLSIPLAARFTPRQVLMGDLAGGLVSVLLLVLLPGRPLVTWIGTFGAGLSMASIFPSALSLAERHTRITGTVTSLFFVGGSIGGMTVPWVIGQLFESVGPQVMILAIALAVVLACVVLGLILASTQSVIPAPVAGES